MVGAVSSLFLGVLDALLPKLLPGFTVEAHEGPHASLGYGLSHKNTIPKNDWCRIAWLGKIDFPFHVFLTSPLGGQIGFTGLSGSGQIPSPKWPICSQTTYTKHKPTRE